MARERGTFNFSASLEVKKQAPLDARQTYIDYSELIQEATWKDSDNKVWLFKGLTVPVNYNGEHALFMLTNPDNYTSTSSWIRVDGGGAESNVYILPGDIKNLSIQSEKLQIDSILGEFTDFDEAFTNNKIILGSSDTHKFIITVTKESSYYGLNFIEFNNDIGSIFYIEVGYENSEWKATGAVTNNIYHQIANNEDVENLDNIYFLGDITTLSESEEVNNIDTKFSNYADFVAAINAKKVFIAKTSLGQFYVNITQNGVNYLCNAIVNKLDSYSYILKFTVNSSSRHWTGISNLTQYRVATSDDLTGKVSAVKATANKGIEIEGSATTPTVGIKLDPTQGNVTLSLGANGLKAEDTTALRDVTGQNFIKKNDTNVEGHLNLTYNTETKKINLEGFDSSIIASIDATAFIKDGMINTVELVTDPESHDPGTYLVITFNTDAGKDAIYLDVSSLIDVYEGHNGIKVTGKDIHLIIDPTSEPYLSLSDNGIKLEGINSKITEVVEQAIIEAFAWHEV
ncbi:MAG: hypothetical protein ACLUZU_12105 [Faecalibacillus intestinalis]|uniref:hypothetical protein n=1 Tax=Faecalibacillus intestinalis TaxID=1982626 RepID=UPI00399BE6BD